MGFEELKDIKGIDYKKVKNYTTDRSSFFRDIPVLKIAKHFIEMKEIEDGVFEGKTMDYGHPCNLKIFTKTNKCFISYEINPDDLMSLLTQNDDVHDAEIKKITGIDALDYIEEIEYEDGQIIKLTPGKHC